MIRFRIKGIPYECPSHLKECNPIQLKAIMAYQLSFGVFDNPTGRLKTKLHLWCTLTGVADKFLRQMTKQEKEKVLRMVGWCRNAKLEHKPFEYFELEGQQFYLPEEGYNNTSAIEVLFTNVALISLKNTKNEKELYNILSIFCRPKRPDAEAWAKSEKYDGDIRVRYNQAAADERRQWFEDKVSPGTLKACIDYIMFMNAQFWDQYDRLLEPDDDDGTEPMYKNGEGLASLLFDIAESRVFGDFEAVGNTSIHTIYTYVIDKQKKVKAAEARMRKQEEND
jgi:hypothetical protein